MNAGTVTPRGVYSLQRAGLVAAVVGLLGCAAGLFVQPEQFFRSYLFGFLFWTFLAVGATGLLMVQHLTGGMWGAVNRRTLEAASRTVPVVALLFVPVAIGVSRIYPWAQAAAASDPILSLKLPYLNAPFFFGRAAVYFSVWMAVVYFLNKWSLEQDSQDDPAIAIRLENLSGAGLVLLGLCGTFASIDWAMSLSPHWFSTIYGLLFIVSGVLAAWSFAILLIGLWGGDEPFHRVASPAFVHDLGKFLLTFVMLWAYIHLSQFLITWSANLPEEITWYMARMKPPYSFLGQALVLLSFVVPFLFLLSRDLKRVRRRLTVVAGVLFAMRVADLLWMIGPEIHAGRLIHWLDIAGWLAVGGIWLWYFAKECENRPLLPVGVPEIRGLLEKAR